MKRDQRDMVKAGTVGELVAKALINALPRCLGTYVKGSGGHTIFARDCDRLATWSDDEYDNGYPFTFCDKHKLPDWEDGYELGWADEVREYESALGLSDD